MNIRGIIFDFDGTLFDSMSIWETAGEEYLASMGYKPEADLPMKLKAMSLMQSARYLQSQYGLPLSVGEIMEGINRTVEDFYFHRAMPKEGVLPVLKAFRNMGMKLCIATATDRYQVEAALKRCNMLSYFDAIFTCTEAGCGKDRPDIFEHARLWLGTDRAATAVFEDAYHAAKTAKDASFFLVGVYDRCEKRTDEIREFADVYVESFWETDKLLGI